MTKKLRQPDVDKLTSGSLTDLACPGLSVRVNPRGQKKVFLIRYSLGGKRRSDVLGPTAYLSLDDARRLAAEWLRKVALGEDPRPAIEEPAPHEFTVQDLCRRYEDEHATRKVTWRDDNRRIAAHILPRWGQWPVSRVTRGHVRELHRSLEATPYEANRTLALISKIWHFGMAYEYIADGPNPGRMIQRYPEQQRQRWVTPEELPRLAAAINREPDPFGRAAIWTALLTGLRKGELLELRWEHIDLPRGQIELTNTKGAKLSGEKKSQYVPIAGPLADMLDSLPRSVNGLVFQGSRGRRLGLRKIWKWVQVEAKLTDVHFHALRHTLASWMAESGDSLRLIQAVLRHKDASTSLRYSHLSQNPAKAALDRQAQRMFRVAGIS